jgi:anti-anti-sigma factor
MKGFSLRIDLDNKIPSVYLSGDITSDASPLLFSAYNEIMKKTNAVTIVFNFDNAHYINSAGISAFIKVLRQHNDINGKFIFTGMSDHLKKVIDIVGLADYITITDEI